MTEVWIHPGVEIPWRGMIGDIGLITNTILSSHTEYAMGYSISFRSLGLISMDFTHKDCYALYHSPLHHLRPTIHLQSSPNSNVSQDIATRAIKAIAEDCSHCTSQSYSHALQGCLPILCSRQFVSSCHYDVSLRALRSSLVPILQWAIDVCLVAEKDSINRRCIRKIWQQFEYLIYRLPWGKTNFTASFRAKLAMQHRISPCVLRALLQILC